MFRLSRALARLRPLQRNMMPHPRCARPSGVADVEGLLAAVYGSTEVGGERAADRHAGGDHGGDIGGEGDCEHGITLRSVGRDRSGVLNIDLRLANQ